MVGLVENYIRREQPKSSSSIDVNGVCFEIQLVDTCLFGLGTRFLSTIKVLITSVAYRIKHTLLPEHANGYDKIFVHRTRQADLPKDVFRTLTRL